MLWLDEVKIRIKNKNQILFTKDSEYLQDLIILFQKQNRKTMILWAHDLAAESIAQLAEKYPEEMRPRGIGCFKRLGCRQNQNAVSAKEDFGLPCFCNGNFQ